MKKILLSIISIIYIHIPAFASNQFLIVGGGFLPKHSEATLEKNVFIFSELMNQFQPQNAKITYLFGGGLEEQNLDVLEQVSDFSLEDTLFSHLFDHCESPNCKIRHNTLGTLLNGEATKRNILDFLDLAKDALLPSEKFSFYFTGHGSHEENTFTQNHLLTWNKEKISVQEFTQKLDHLADNTQTQVVMVQCYAGGFAQINYEGGDKSKPLSSANRCGFFAQVADRVSAGCTPDLNKREEYSHYFWDAYRGKTEEGQSLQTDFNHDGKVTSDEAHAYVTLSENSIDIPITTSSQLLRDQGFGLSTEKKRTSWKEFQARLTPIEQAIVEGLQEKTGYDIKVSATPFVFVEEKITHIQRMKDLSLEKAMLAQNLVDEIFVQIKNKLSMRYSIFHNSYGENQGDLLSAQFRSVQNAKQEMLAHPEFHYYQELFLKRREANEEIARWDQLKTKWERIQYLLETKLFEEILSASSLETVKQKYQNLKECEASSFF